MSQSKILTLIAAMVLMLNACFSKQATTNVNDVATMVAQTMTAYSESMPTSTSTPLPSPTETATPTQVIPFPTVIPAGSPYPTPKPEYACDIIDQRPYDDTKFHPNDEFDIKWTIVNTGTQKWEHGTYLIYQSGPLMTPTKKLELPKLKPGERYEVILDAVAPTERDMQIMVFAVVGPGTIKGSEYWMCYPYVRIIVGK